MKKPFPTAVEKGCIFSTTFRRTDQGVLLGVRLVAYGQFGAAFGAAASQNFTAVLRAHAATETVLVYTTALGWLERSFHCSLFWDRAVEPTGRFVKGRKDKGL